MKPSKNMSDEDLIKLLKYDDSNPILSHLACMRMFKFKSRIEELEARIALLENQKKLYKLVIDLMDTGED